MRHVRRLGPGRLKSLAAFPTVAANCFPPVNPDCDAMRLPNVCLLAVMLFPASTTAIGQDWTRFRGENGTGLSDVKGIPVTWTAADVAWTTALDHVGHSSPVVHGKSLFVTTATEGGGERFLVCLNADTGVQQWQVSVTLAESHKHAKNSWASSTPTTDGRRVYCLFADSQKLIAAAWDFAGEPVWSKELGSYESEHGLGVSPIVQDGLLIVPNDQVGPSSLIALHAETGEIAWQTERRPGKTSYSTPMVIGSGPEAQLINVSEANGVTSHALQSGILNWQTPSLPMRTVASPVEANGLVFATCGEGGNGKYFAAVKVDPQAESNSRVAWERRTMLPYVPCINVVNDHAFLWGDKGILVCLDATSGEQVWFERIDGEFSGSPICIEDRLYCVTERGEVVVVRAGTTFEELGRTSLGDDCHSTPAVANGHLYFHTFHKVVAVKASTK